MLRSLLDWIWPTLEGAGKSSALTLPSVALTPEIAKELCTRLEAAVEADVDRMKSIDAKLMAVCAVAPICVTLLLAIVSFVTTQRPGTFTPSSVFGITALACYVILQFLRALLAAIEGLHRRGFLVPTPTSLWAQTDQESLDAYTLRACADLAERLHANRETTNDKVSHMALAHRAYRNALVGMLVAVMIVGGLILYEHGAT